MNNLRVEKSEFYGLYRDYREYEDKFFNWYRMSTKQFDNLLEMIRRRIRKNNTNFRESVYPEEQLCIMIM